MALIHEETVHPDFGVELMVSERYGSEVREPWRIVSMSLEHFHQDMSPKELRELGRWLISEGKRIGREYKSNGSPKAAKETA